ncbi:hypothetical protein MANES_03G213025v8 [Manihot esculenta]|uniref:Uncharacterized protein n=1 Tax=Manihot esculenta TaxID=3983 RepID=A0ACB7I4Z9_MANES|nr:hypothetical protein MANES_03G213025v8 [Manihot esculenta]
MALCQKMICHIFLHWSMSWQVYSWFLKWLDFRFCLPNSISSLLLEWRFIVHGKSIWLSRNEKVFHNKEVTIDFLCSLIFHQVAGYTILNLLITVDTIKCWAISSIGGVIRECSGSFMCVFSCLTGILDSNAADFLAIEKALSNLATKPDIWSSKQRNAS